MILGQPKILPELDPNFRPASLWVRDFEQLAASTDERVPFRLALAQPNGTCAHQSGCLLPADHPEAAANYTRVERLLKFLLWACGGSEWYWDGPKEIGHALQERFTTQPCGRFDREFMERVYERPFEGRLTANLPKPRGLASPLGRHLNGNRIGFDLGGSDRKVAAVVDGEVVFSEETPWDPYHQSDPNYHRQGILDSIDKAMDELPWLDAIGGSSAGVFVENRPRVGSLFRGISDKDFAESIRPIFQDIGRKYGVPIAVINDGEVTALAASMSLDLTAVMGVAMGTSEAAGYVDPEGRVTSWLNELAFAPIDYAADAPADEWSGDIGCGVQYFSQQAVGRLIPKTRLEIDPALGLPVKLEKVQDYMAQGHEDARKIYSSIGTYLGYGIAHYTRFYQLDHILILGRVTSGAGGDIILDKARDVLRVEFPELASRLKFHQPDEKNKRHGQAIAAASLPATQSQ